MVLLADVFLLLTQVLLWLVVGGIVWYVLARLLPKAFLGILVILLILAVLGLSFWSGAPQDPGILDLLWRIISFPLQPFGLGLILLSVLLFGKGPGKLVRNIILGSLIILALGSLPIVAHFLVQELEMEAIEVIQPAPPLPADARRVIVLLGTGTTRFQLRPPTETRPATAPETTQTPLTPGSPPTTTKNNERAISRDAIQILASQSVQITETGDRILYAAQLYREEADRGNRPLILVSAGQYRGRLQKEGEKREDVSETRAIQTLLSDRFGVPASDILPDYGGSLHIRRSAVSAQRLLEAQRINYGNQLMLVSSALNMNRAFLTFRNVFPNATIIARPTDFITVPTRSSLTRELQGRDIVELQIQLTDFLPSSEAFCLSSRALEEYLAALYYFLRGWITPFQPTR